MSRAHFLCSSLLPQSHLTTGPYVFYHPYGFLPVRPSEAPVGFLRWCCSRGHIRLRAPYGLTRLYTYGLVEWFARLHGCSVRCPYGHRADPARESSMFFISYGTRTGPVRDPQGCRTAPLRTRKGIDTTKIDKNPTRASYLTVRGRTGPLRSPHGLFKGCLGFQNPYGARKLYFNACIKTPRAPYRQNSYGARADPVSGRMIFVQNSLGTAREQPVRGPGVWCDWWHKITRIVHPVYTWCDVMDDLTFEDHVEHRYMYISELGWDTDSAFGFTKLVIADCTRPLYSEGKSELLAVEGVGMFFQCCCHWP